MDPHSAFHARPDSFKPEFTARPAGFRTPPPPPSSAIEPLSPHLTTTNLANPNLPDRKRRRYEEQETYKISRQRVSKPGSTDAARLVPPAVASQSPAASNSHPTTYFRSQLSPTALDVFAAVATSPDLGQGEFDAATNRKPTWTPPQRRGASGRGSKRSHSEIINYRPQQQDTAGPSASYLTTSISTGGHTAPSLKLEAYGQPQARYISTDSAAVSDSRLEEAELLLGFARGGNRQHYPHGQTSPRRDLWNSPNNDRRKVQSSWTRTQANGGSSEMYSSQGALPNGEPRARGSIGDSRSKEGTVKPNGTMRSWPAEASPQEPVKKPRVHKGWPKGKPRGKRNSAAGATQAKKPTAKRMTKAEKAQQAQLAQKKESVLSKFPAPEEYSLPRRPDSANRIPSRPPSLELPVQPTRASSVPLNVLMAGPDQKTKSNAKREPKISLCAHCHKANSPNGFHELWITCNGCKEWFHTVCVGFKTEREVRDVDKFYCTSCEPTHGKTTFVRKSSRAHASVDYAGLNEGQIRTSADTYEHHFIQPIKDGSFEFLPEKFPRMPPELLTAAFFERSGTMSEPVLIPASMNPRPAPSEQESSTSEKPDFSEDLMEDDQSNMLLDEFEYDCVPDDGQDKLDMVMPRGLTVRHVSEVLGPDRPLQVIDVKSQDQGDTTWNLRKWADYYETPGEKPVRNVISLEVSQTKLSRLIRRPRMVRDLDLQDQVWPQHELDNGKYPQVQFYCLMSVADCYTDFHIDFGGSSVYYHILRGKKTFFFIPPKKQHLKKYEEWCVSPNQESIFLGEVTKECYRVDLSEGDTMLIPSGWIHAVWTPENSLVIGGNFLTRMHYSMQIQINEIEKNTGVARMFRYPNFQKVMWYTVIQYLQEDPVPHSVAQTLYNGGKFVRETPVYFDFEPSDDDEEIDEFFNARYYSEGEIEGLADLLSFVYRTVMISLGLIPLAKTKQDAVTRSLPKGYGDHLELLRTFALWIAWKRGNEELPVWAHPDAPISELEDAMSEKKAPTTASKKSDRKLTTPERRSQRQAPKAQETDSLQAIQPEFANEPHKDEPSETSLTPKRAWCETCRRSRVRCKHRQPGDQLDDTERFGVKPGIRPAFYISVPEPSGPSETATEQPGQEDPSDPAPLAAYAKEGESDAGHQSPGDAPINGNTLANPPQARIKACEECRKSKRRCIHDADGNIDPVKAMQNPIPRAFSATKRIRNDRSSNELPPPKRAKGSPVQGENKAEDSYEGNGEISMVIEPGISSIYPDAQVPANGTPSFASEDTFVANGSPEDALVEGTALGQSDLISPAGMYSVEENQSNEVDGSEADLTLTEDIVNASKGDGTHHNIVEQHSISNDAPANSSGSENRSRTPSLHIQTNSTESAERSRSPPTSPLTEVDASSPVVPKQEETLEDVPKVHLNPSQAIPDHIDVNDPIQIELDAKPPQTPNKASAQGLSKSTSKVSRRVSSTRSNASRSMSREVGLGIRNKSPLYAASPRSQAVSPSVETVEEESMRLARQLQEQEFGLRRRSK